MHPAAARVLGRPHANATPVRANRQAVIMWQHVLLEPLGVQALFPLDTQAPANGSPTPYFKVVVLALVVQIIGGNPDARLFASFPDGGVP